MYKALIKKTFKNGSRPKIQKKLSRIRVFKLRVLKHWNVFLLNILGNI